MQPPSVDEFRGNSRFSVQWRIGQGGMGVVFRAVDLERKELVALKTLRQIDGKEIYRLKREFRALSELMHPNLVRLYELFAEGEHWFFSMELVTGVNFQHYVLHGARHLGDESISDRTRQFESTTHISSISEYSRIRPAGDTQSLSADPGSIRLEGRSDLTSPADGPIRRTPVQLMRLRRSLRQLAEGIQAIHRAGMLHRDIKPSNVLVSREGRVIVLDFGLALQWKQEYSAQTDIDAIVGTVAYMSPEQAAGEPLTPASDWYSVGVMLYEILTGSVPFHGARLKVLMDKQQYDPPPPRAVVPELPADLSDLCAQLLCRDPAGRPSGREVLLRLGAEVADDISSSSSISSMTRFPFVGRRSELDELGRCLNAVRTGRTVLACVTGRSGLGKSALIEHFLADAIAQDETVLLAGKCYEYESVPYKAVDGLIDSLSHYLVGLPRAEADAIMPRDMAALARLFPVLRRVDSVAAAPRRRADTPDLQELRGRAFHALRELLSRLGDRRTLVLSIDDMQWGDLDSIALLNELLRPPDPPALLLLAAFRSEDTSTEILQTFRRTGESRSPVIDYHQIAVEPFAMPEACQLARSLLGTEEGYSDELVRSIATEAHGNPYFIDALARQVQLEAKQTERATVPQRVSLDDVLWSRVQHLPDEAQRLVQLVAVAGQPVPQAELLRAAGAEAAGHGGFDLLRLSRLVRTTGRAPFGKVETYHDRIRETVTHHLTLDQLQQLHGMLGRALESSGNCDAATLAAHFVAAGLPERAGEYYAAAADQAAQALAFDRAATLYRLALENQDGNSMDGRLLRSRLADALANAGRGREAAEQYRAAAVGAPAADSLEFRRRAAMQSLISGHIDDGLDALRSVLNTAGMHLPSTPKRALVSLLWQRARIRLRGLKFKRRDTSQITAEQLARCDICWAASTGLSIVDTIRGADFQSRGLWLSLQLGEPYRVARSLAMEAAHLATAGRPVEARVARLLNEAQQLAEEARSAHALGLTLAMRGLSAFLQGRWRIAAEQCDHAEQMFRNECQGVAWEINTAQSFALWARFYLGDVAELTRRLPRLLAEAEERGNLYALNNLGTFARPLADMAADDAEGANEHLRSLMDKWSQEGFHVQHLNGLYGRVQIEIYRQRGAVARQLIEDAWPAVKASMLLRVQQVRIIFKHVRARCWLAAMGGRDSPSGMGRVVLKLARELECEPADWAAPLARLLRAAIAAREGHHEAASQLLDKAAAEFDAAHMSLFANSARRRLGQLRGDASGQQLVDQIDRWMQSQNIVNPECMTALHVPGF